MKKTGDLPSELAAESNEDIFLIFE